VTATATGGVAHRPDPARRAAAVGALALTLAAVAIGVVGLVGDVGRLVAVPPLLLATAATAFTAATRRGTTRVVALVATVAMLAVLATVLLTADGMGLGLVVVVALLAGSAWLTRYALRRDAAALKAQAAPGTPAGPARQGVLILNLRSGGGKAERHALVDECRRRGIEPVVLQRGDDLLELAQRAIDGGADVIGMAGGDGSQALVASVAMAADVPLVCVPAGTRNHFALDLGLDRDDVVGALDAFDEAVERRIDLAEVSGRVFVNNVSLGVYAKIVQSPEYRDAKRQTTAAMLPELLGPDAEPFDLHFAGPDGTRRDGAQIVQISNNPYVLSSLAGFGGRPRIDTGTLGIAAAKIGGAADVAAFVAAESAGRVDRFGGWTEWAAPTFTVESGAPVEAGVDGEAMVLDQPLEFRILPGALRVRIPTSAPGYSPAALKSPSIWWTLSALVRTVAGHAIPIDEAQR
jgi:diacylglycerol kinase family enzyme